MQKLFILLCVLCVIGISSCHKSGSQSGKVVLKLNPMFGSAKLNLNQVYGPTPDGKYYDFTKFYLYLSHIRLVRSDASSVEVAPWVFIGLDDSTTLTIPLADSLGSFVGLQFGIGVDSVQDNTDPGTITSANLLESINDEMYWSSTLKFVFVQLEGMADTTPNPQGVSGIRYHVGTPPYYTTVPLTSSMAFSVSASGQTTLTLSTDIQRIFYGPNAINILSTPGTQTTDFPAVAQTFMSDFAQSFSLTAN